MELEEGSEEVSLPPVGQSYAPLQGETSTRQGNSSRREPNSARTSSRKSGGLWSSRKQMFNNLGLSAIFGRRSRDSGFLHARDQRDSDQHASELVDQIESSFGEIDETTGKPKKMPTVSDSLRKLVNKKGSMNNSTMKEHPFQKHRPQKKKRNPVSTVVLAFVLIATVLVMVTFFVVDVTRDGESNTDGSFCGSFEADEAVRQLLADEFDNVLQNQGPNYRNVNIECLPADIFSKLSDIQQDQFLEGTFMRFELNGLTKVSPNAFRGELFEEIEIVSFKNNGLSELPEDLFVDLPNLEQVFLDANAFSTISGKALELPPRLRILSLKDNSGLVEVPETIKNLEISTLDLAGTTSLVKIEDLAFPSTITLLDITDSPQLRSLIQLRANDLGSLGLSQDVVIVGQFQ